MSSIASPYEMTDEQRFELLIGAVSEYAICMLDPHGFVTSWNTGAERITGYRPIEILNQHFSRFFTVNDQAKRIPDQILNEARTTGHFEGEGWRIRKDGGQFWAMNTVQPVRDQAGRLIGFAKITRDITERMAAQEALHESERRFRLLVDGVIDYAIYMLDPSGIISNWNAGAERMKGYTADEIVGQHFSRFYTKEDRAAGLPVRVLEAAAREGRYEAEGWRVRKDDSRFWASVVVDAIRDESGEILGFAKVTRDITERRAAQEAIRESERQFRLLVNGITDYALFMLDPNGIVTTWNTGAERLKGYRANDIIGQHFSRFYTEQDRAAGVPARALHTATQEGRYEAEGWRMRRDGGLFWANVVIDAIRDENGNLLGFAKITRDITERRDAELALQEAQAQRDHAQKVEMLGRLTGGVAHDFNNLLMIISGHIEALKQIALAPKGKRAVAAIEHAAGRGEALTRQLLTFSRRQTLNPEVGEIAERIKALRAMLTSYLGPSVKLVDDIRPDIWPIQVDVDELELALLNIALNARDAMPQGGVITVIAENVQLRPTRTQTLEGDFVALTIADTGVGIPADILQNVFEPFFTTKPAGKGSGLGLSQVNGFAHQSGGTVTIESELGRGTRVTLYLPRAQGKPGQKGDNPLIESSSGGTVLLVEDNPEVAEATVTLLEQLGYHVQMAESADAALQSIERHKFDLVVSDVVMAGSMDGVGLARAIRQRWPDLAVILVTGYSDIPGRADNEFPMLRKPYRLAELSRAAANAIAAARLPPSTNVVRLHQTERGG